mgnify:CR=1 FL=1
MLKNTQQLLDIMSRLRNPEGGCAWDIKQDFTTLIPYLIEEAYEVVDAIERNDLDDLRKELGEEKYQQITYLSKPIAAASIAQVHFAKIINNEKKEIDVAIKILRPNIEKIFHKELDALRFLASIIEFSVKKSRRLKLVKIIDLLKEITNIEMDLRYEAAAASELKKKY